MVINTAEYCHVTAADVRARLHHAKSDADELKLEEKMKEKISDEFRERVSLQQERDQFVR